MKKIFIALFAFFSVLAYSDNHERGTWVAAEYHFCNFNEGQDVDDLLRVVGKFNKFLDEYADKGQYDAVLLQEVYDVDNDFNDELVLSYLKFIGDLRYDFLFEHYNIGNGALKRTYTTTQFDQVKIQK